jgi:hypothetical protein
MVLKKAICEKIGQKVLFRSLD